MVTCEIADVRKCFCILILFLQSWRDDRLQWNVSEYEGLNVLHVPSYIVWQPDIVLINK